MYKYLIVFILLFISVPVHADDYNNIMKDYIINSTPVVNYSDITQVPWAEQAIMFLSKYHIVQGTQNDLFSPDLPITRAEYTKIVISAFGLYDDNAKISFLDSTPTDWHNKFIGSAVKNNISQGISSELYGVNDNITREEMFVMTYRALKAAKLSLAQSTEVVTFTDKDLISSYTQEAIEYLSSAKIITGDPSGKLLPQDPSTRAESCVLIFNILRSTLEGESK